jgi:hypothetical protein
MPEIRSSSFSWPSVAAFSSSWSCLRCVSRSAKPCSRRELPVDLLFLRQHSLFDLDDLAAFVAELVLHVGPELQALLLGLDLRLAADRLGGSRRLLRDARLLVSGDPKTAADEEAHPEHGEKEPGRKADQNADSKLHWSLLRHRP